MFVITAKGPCLLGLLGKHTDSISPYNTNKNSNLNLTSLLSSRERSEASWAPYLLRPSVNINLDGTRRSVFYQRLPMSAVNSLI